jgi:hypothetical protein
MKIVTSHQALVASVFAMWNVMMDRLSKMSKTMHTSVQMLHHPKNIAPKTIPFNISRWCNIPEKVIIDNTGSWSARIHTIFVSQTVP